MSSNHYTTTPTLGLLSGSFFGAVLTFSLLAGGAVAFGSELFAAPGASRAQLQAAAPVVVLPEVIVTGQRIQRTEVAGAAAARSTEIE
ncbi:MAG: hypothetical protein M3Z16_10695 [Pseudomonadota bacterium]|nr:hypothetical protein [Pseudomonadota bacterium]